MLTSEIIEIYNNPLTQVLELNISEIEAIEIQQALVIQQQGSEIEWISITEGQQSIQMVANKGYLLANSVITDLFLPLNPQNNQYLEIYAANQTSFIIKQSTTDRIRFGNQITSIGVTGQIAGTEIGDHLKLWFYSGIWRVLSGSQGNFHIS